MDGPADDPFGDAGDPAAQNQGAGREAALRHGIDGAASPAERHSSRVPVAVPSETRSDSFPPRSWSVKKKRGPTEAVSEW